MYVVDRPSRRPPAAALPSYDVKIIAGRRVVIFHDPAKQSPKVERAETTSKATPDNPHVGDVRTVEDTSSHQSDLRQAHEKAPKPRNKRSKSAGLANDAEEDMLATKASSVPAGKAASRLKSTAAVPPHPNYFNSRRRSLSETFTVKAFEEEHSKYPVLPPLTQSNPDKRLGEKMSRVSERAVEAVLREMRKTDRDRDRVLRPEQIHQLFFHKYRLPLTERELADLQAKFADATFQGMTNYEDLIKHLLKLRSKFQSRDPATEQAAASIIPKRPDHSALFESRVDAKLILGLEEALATSPKFELDKFRSHLEAKDMYGNEQVSKQHVMQAATTAKLVVPKDVMGAWLAASDPVNRGFYSIPKLVELLQRSRPDVIARVRNSAAKAPIKSPEPQNLQDLSYLKQALARSHQEVPGYLSAEDLRHVCTTYSAAYQMNISKGKVEEAIGKARSADPLKGLVNIGLFCRFLDDVLSIRNRV